MVDSNNTGPASSINASTTSLFVGPLIGGKSVVSNGFVLIIGNIAEIIADHVDVVYQHCPYEFEKGKSQYNAFINNSLLY